MSKRLFILFALILSLSLFGRDSLKTEGETLPELRSEAVQSRMSLQPSTAGHESLLSPERLSQFRSLSLGYSSNGSSSVSAMSYLHGFDYVFGPNLRTSATFELSRYSSKTGESVELTPTVRMDWRPFESARVTLDLRMPPQKLGGTGLDSNYKSNFLRR